MTIMSYCALWTAPKRCPTYIVSKSKKSVVKGSTNYACTCSKKFRTYYRRVNRKFEKYCIKIKKAKKQPNKQTSFCSKLSEIACATSTLCRWNAGACAMAPTTAPTPAQASN